MCVGLCYTRLSSLYGELGGTALSVNKLLREAPPARTTTQDSASTALGSAPLLRTLLWVAGLCFALWAAWLYGEGGGVHNDFTQNVWLPSRLLLDGADPYFTPRPVVDATLGSYASEFALFNSGTQFHFIYPVWVALVLAPFGALPLAAATAVWRAANLVLLIWSAGAVLRSSNPAFRASSPVALSALALTIGLAVFYRESLLTLIIGQFAVIEFALLTAVWSWLIRSRAMEPSRRMVGDMLTGTALAVLATKPQAVGLVVGLLGLWAISRKRYLIPVSAAVSLAALLLVPLLFYPNSLNDWFGVVFGGQAASQTEVSASVWGLSYHLLGSDSPWRLLALGLALLGVVAILPLWWRDLRDRTSPLPMSLLITLVINSLVSPYMLGYEHVLLLLPALVLVAAAGLPNEVEGARPDLKKLRLAIYGWMAVLPLLIVAIQGVWEVEWPAFAQSLPMLAILIVTMPHWREAPAS
jgi:hypothetical protein